MGLFNKSLITPKIEIGLESKFSRGWSFAASYVDFFSNDNESVGIFFGKTVKLQAFYQYRNWSKHRAIFTFEKTDIFYNDRETRKHTIQFGHEYSF